MSEYTPTTGEVRGWYLGLGIAGRAELSSECANEFDRWLALVKADAYRMGYNKATADIVDEGRSRKAKADAFDGCAQEAHDLGWLHEDALADVQSRNPYRGEQA
jgi:hypothetical protein